MPSGLPTVGCMRDYFAYDPPKKPTVMALVASAQIQRKWVFFVFFSLLHRWAANTSGHLPITLPPLFAPSFIFPASAVCCLCTFPKFIKKDRKEGGWRWLGGMGPEEAERGSRRVKGEGLGWLLEHIFSLLPQLNKVGLWLVQRRERRKRHPWIPMEGPDWALLPDNARVYCWNLLTLLHGKPWELQSGGNFSFFSSPAPCFSPPLTTEALQELAVQLKPPTHPSPTPPSW